VAPTHRLTCSDVLRRLDDYLDRELSDAELLQVREHLDTCVTCAAEHRFEASVLLEIRRKLRRLKAPSAVIDRVRARLARAGSGSEP
jgi:anti-sigma factor (TIGR02949 family)